MQNQYSSLHICEIVYYVMNCLPLLVEMLYDVKSIKKLSEIFYRAMTDETTACIYNIFTIITCYVFYKYANKYTGAVGSLNNLKQYGNNVSINIVLTLLMFVPLLVGILMSPNPDAYFQYCYFYFVNRNPLSVEYIYHREIMGIVQRIAFTAVLLKYYFKNNPRFVNCIDVYSCVFVITWVNQKRTSMIFLMLGILVIDFLKKNHPNIKEYLKKCTLFIIIIVSYFVYYSANVKSTGGDSFNTYTAYFSRLNVEKVAIYDILYDNKLLEYRGQSLLYDFLWFVPRTFWPDKPGMYCKYFTAYVETGRGTKDYWQPFNYQVNIWGDWVSSLGLFGHFLALIFLIWTIRYTEQSGNKILKYIGFFFVILYLMYGFEHIICFLYLLLLAFALKDKIRLIL